MLLELDLPAEGHSVTRARQAASEVARAVGAPEIDVKIAVSEAVGNAVTHAFRGEERGTITVRAYHERKRLVVSVTDDGDGMRPHLESPGLGLGISLITKVAENVRFDSTDAGTTVSMSFGTSGAVG